MNYMFQSIYLYLYLFILEYKRIKIPVSNVGADKHKNRKNQINQINEQTCTKTYGTG